MRPEVPCRPVRRMATVCAPPVRDDVGGCAAGPADWRVAPSGDRRIVEAGALDSADANGVTAAELGVVPWLDRAYPLVDEDGGSAPLNPAGTRGMVVAGGIVTLTSFVVTLPLISPDAGERPAACGIPSAGLVSVRTSNTLNTLLGLLELVPVPVRVASCNGPTPGPSTRCRNPGRRSGRAPAGWPPASPARSRGCSRDRRSSRWSRC